jgi:hypothetical protein
MTETGMPPVAERKNLATHCSRLWRPSNMDMCWIVRLCAARAANDSGLAMHPLVQREHWRCPDYCRQPLIERLKRGVECRSLTTEYCL